MEKDIKLSDGTHQSAIVDTTNSTQMKGASPIVIKIEAPKEAIKTKVVEKSKSLSVDDIQKPSAKSRCCQLLPVILFLITFATVLSLLIMYMDPSSK
jgi:hypothetical protein